MIIQQKCKIKFLTILLMLLLITGCKNLNYKKELKERYAASKPFFQLYEKWDLENAEKELELLINKYPEEKGFLRINKEIPNKKLKKEEFTVLSNTIKNNLENNEVKKIKKYIDKSVLNVLKFNELSSYDLKKFKFYYGEPEFCKNKSSLLVVLNYLDDLSYFKVKFEIKDGSWKIVDFVKEGE